MGDYDSVPERVELSSLVFGGWESEHLSVGLRFDDGTTMTVEFERQSREVGEVLDLLTQLVNDSLRRRGLGGLEITGLVELEDEE